MNWELDSIYPNERAFFEECSQAREKLKGGPLEVQEGAMLVRQLDSFVSCRLAADTADARAQVMNAEVGQLHGLVEEALFRLGNALVEGDVVLEDFPEIAFILDELKAMAELKGSKEEEGLVNALLPDGYHSFWALYQQITGKMRIEGDSIGQAQNRLSDTDRDVRLRAFETWSEGWKGEVDVLAQLLNYMGGFRLKLYEMRGWDDVLMEPLMLNRMAKETFEAMWAAIQRSKKKFVAYLEAKAKLLGVERLSWVDVEVPIGKAQEVSFDEAMQVISDQFSRFHPPMADFAREAFDKGWIEAEDRKGKAAGGWCFFLPKSDESRVFMTFKGTASNVSTLAHELGHAYHNRCLEGLPYFLQDARMNVAETASTFAEMVVLDQMVERATGEQKLQLLDDKLQRSCTFFMNIEARLLFERAFYAERAKGFVAPERLCALMELAQKEAFLDSLADYDPLLWASKFHFYFTPIQFCNFPYTFGYLMSNGVYSRVKEGGVDFDAFLRDTGSMTTEALAEKHLGTDLGKPDFWEESLSILEKDVDLFLSLQGL